MTREEAIEAIKAKMGYYESDKRLRAALETLIHELAESEDEKIRKDIIQFILYKAGHLLDRETEHKFIAYLEKRKDLFKDGVGHYFYDGHTTYYIGAPAMEELQPNNEWNKEDENIIEGMIVDYKGEIEHLSNSMIDEQAKPVYQERIDFLNRLKTCYPQSYNDDAQKKIDDAIYLIEHYASHGHDKNLREKVVSGLKSLPLNLKKKSEDIAELCSNEWGEEDENTINIMIAILRENHPNGLFKTNPVNTTCMSAISTDMLIKRIESLRPQPHKEIYQAAKHDLAIKFMNYLDENRPDGKMGLSNGECEDIDKAFKENDWAKIMRYYEKYRLSWKPSEEQMKALQKAVNKLAKTDVADSVRLSIMYDNLKKLM